MKAVLDLSWRQKEVQPKNHNRTFHLSQKPDILKSYQHAMKAMCQAKIEMSYSYQNRNVRF
jgi:hypothetical protein